MGKKNIKFLFSNTAIYAVSNLLQRGLAFLLLPLYTFYFTKAEFGAMDQIYHLISIIILITSFGLPHGLKRGIYLDSPSKENNNKIVGVLIIFLVSITFLFALIFWFSTDFLTQILFNNEGKPIWIKLSIFYYITLSIYQIPIQLLKTNHQAGRVALWSLITFILIAIGNIYLIAAMKLGLVGLIIGNILGFSITGILLVLEIKNQIRFNLNFSRLKPLFAYGLPMLPALLARKILEVSDRYILPYYHGMSDLGNYVMAAKVALIIEVLILVPFLNAWQPFFYSHSKNPEAPKLFASITHYIFMILCLAFLILKISCGWLLSFLGNGRFPESEPIVSWLVLAIFFNGIQYCISPGIHLCKKLIHELTIMIMAAVVNLILNIFLIPPFGGAGAAVATAMSYFFYLTGTFILSQKYYPVAYLWSRMANVLIQTIITFILLIFLKGFILKCLIITIYIISCLGLDLWRHGELKTKDFSIFFAKINKNT